MIRYLSLKETGTSYEQKSDSTENHGKRICSRQENQTNRTRAENFYVSFFVIFDFYCPKFISGGKI